MRNPRLVVLIAVLVGTNPVARGEEPVALEVVGVRPDQQLAALLALFEGSRASSPAAALAGWRNATGRDDVPGKAWQAAIAALNPSMVRELQTLDGVEVLADFDPAGSPRWCVFVPGDDGTFAALATALALTDGAAEEPLRPGVPVDRLGPPGSPLLARPEGGAVAMAGSREALRWGLDRSHAIRPAAGVPSGWLAQLDREALGRSTDPDVRRLAGVLRGLGVEQVEAAAGLDGELLAVSLASSLERTAQRPAPIDADWLDLVPSEGVSAAFALAIDAETVGRAFRAAEAFEQAQADPSRPGTASIRTRLNLLANAAGVRPEVEVWPVLRGLSGFLAGDGSGGLLALHAADGEAAARLATSVVPRLARPWGGTLVAGDHLEIQQRGPLVLIGWGDGSIRRAVEALEDPARSSGGRLRAEIGSREASRFAAFWPGSDLAASLAPLPPSGVSALADAPPLIWVGWRDGETARDLLRWSGLRGSIRRLLETIPIEPPANRSPVHPEP